jgi:hypothetical protein
VSKQKEILFVFNQAEHHSTENNSIMISLESCLAGPKEF